LRSCEKKRKQFTIRRLIEGKERKTRPNPRYPSGLSKKGSGEKTHGSTYQREEKGEGTSSLVFNPGKEEELSNLVFLDQA